MLTSVKFGPRGGIKSISTGGSYPYGIRKNKSPNGAGYFKYKTGKYHSEATLRLRKLANEGDEEAASDAGMEPGGHVPDEFVLRYLDRLYDGLKYYISQAGNVWIRFENKELNARSNKLEKGGRFRSQALSSNSKKQGSGMRTVTLPPRPHRGIQPAYRIVVNRIINAWVRQYGKQKV